MPAQYTALFLNATKNRCLAAENHTYSRISNTKRRFNQSRRFPLKKIGLRRAIYDQRGICFTQRRGKRSRADTARRLRYYARGKSQRTTNTGAGYGVVIEKRRVVVGLTIYGCKTGRRNQCESRLTIS